jgi:uncharacterized protein YigE (DUF2233 family)
MNKASIVYALSMMVLYLLQPIMAFAQVVPIQHNGQSYYIYKVDLRTANLQFHWKSGPQPLAAIENLKRSLAAEGQEMTFATNGGIYSPNLNPLGLYIENGRQLNPINNKAGNGNYYLKPNAVFYIGKNKSASIVTSEKYAAASAGKEIEYALQSGPQLVIDGKIHPEFQAGSANLNVRSGVGIISEHEVVFAISVGEVNFYEFASLFKDKFLCRNALYLDGTVSNMYGLPFKGGFSNTHGTQVAPFSVMISDSRPSGKPSIPAPSTDTFSPAFGFGILDGLTTSFFPVEEYAIECFPIEKILPADSAEPFFILLEKWKKENKISRIAALYTGSYYPEDIGIYKSRIAIWNGKASIIDMKDKTTPADYNLFTGDVILRNGQPTPNAFGNAAQDDYSALGVLPNGAIVMIASDASTERKGGRKITQMDLAIVLQRYGCVDGVILAPDGAVHSCIPGKKDNWNAKIDRSKVYMILAVVKK